MNEYEEIQKMNDEYRQLVKQCADQGRSLAQMMANQGISEPLYLYCRPSVPGKGPGRLMLARDSAPNPEGLPLVTGEGLRSNVEFSRYDDWIFQRAKRAPILSN
jgi:hypothetical protein